MALLLYHGRISSKVLCKFEVSTFSFSAGNFLKFALSVFLSFVVTGHLSASLFHRLIHGVLSCGVTEPQYTSFSRVANIGSEGEKTFDTGY